MRILLILFILFIYCGECFAENEIQIPASPTVANQNDLSLSVINRLFGSTANFLIGNGSGAIDNGDGFFAGLIVSILGVLNLAAMVYVSSMIIYMWGVFAVTTAHKGENLGGSVYNSLWVPVRHAMSFGLTVPLVKGFSAMQLTILLLIGLSINFANAIWDFSSNYLVKNINISTQATNNRNDSDAVYKFIPLMFNNAVYQNILMDKKLYDKEQMGDKNYWLNNYRAAQNNKGMPEYKYTGYDPENKQGFAYQEYPINYSGGIDNNGLLVRGNDYSGGRIVIKQRSLKFINKANPGIIQIQMPEWRAVRLQHEDNVSAEHKKKPTVNSQPHIFDGPGRVSYDRQAYWMFTNQGVADSPDYKVRLNFSEKKAERVTQAWNDINEAAKLYLHSKGSGEGENCAIQPCNNYTMKEAGEYVGKTVDNVIKSYIDGVKSDTSQAINDYMSNVGGKDNKSKMQQMIANAINNTDNGKSSLGWMSAGLIPFTLSAVQDKIHKVTNADVIVYEGDINEYINELKKDNKINQNYVAGMEKSGNFLDSNMKADSSYVSAYKSKMNDDNAWFGFNELKNGIVNAFGTSETNLQKFNGALGWVLSSIEKQEPVLVLQGFGSRLVDAATHYSLLTFGLGFLTNSFALFFACVSLFAIGVFFAYVVPFIPVVYWIKALISWIYIVIESMVAAPFWVCAHALPEGKGFAGQHAKRGYIMLLDILIRPALLVIGVVCAIVLSQIAGTFIYKLFNIWLVNVVNAKSIGLLADIIYAILVMSIIYSVYYTIFTKGIGYVPEHVIQWCGGGGVSGLRDEDEGTEKIIGAGGSANQIKGLATGSSNRLNAPDLARKLKGIGQ